MDPLIDRRSWLKWFLEGSCLLGLGSFVYAGLSFLGAEAPEAVGRGEPGDEPPEPRETDTEPAPDTEAVASPGRMAGGSESAEDLPVGGSKMIALGSTPVIVVRQEAGVRAFGAVCTHLGCLVRWNPSSRTFDCPCHGGKYDSDGRVIAGPPPRDLVEYPASAVGQAFATLTRARAAGGPGGGRG